MARRNRGSVQRAQGAALMAGKANADPARAYAGDRPSSTILLKDLDPRTLGALIEKNGGKVTKEIYPPITATDFSAYVSDLRAAARDLDRTEERGEPPQTQRKTKSILGQHTFSQYRLNH